MKKKTNQTNLLIALITLVAVGLATGFQPAPEATNVSLIDDPSLPGFVDELEQWVELNPDDIDARQKLSLKLYEAGRRDEAVEELQKASDWIRKETDHAVAMMLENEAPNR